MTNHLDIVKGVNSLRKHVKQGLQTVADLSGDAYRIAKKAEKTSQDELSKYKLEVKRETNQSRLDNLARIRSQLAIKKNKENQIKINQDFRNLKIENVNESLTDISRRAPSESIANKRNIEALLKAREKERQAKIQDKSENIMDLKVLETLITDKLKTINIHQEVENIKTQQISEKLIVSAKLIVNAFCNQQLITSQTSTIDVIKHKNNHKHIYEAARFNTSYLPRMIEYQLLDKLPIRIEFDDSLKAVLNLNYSKIEIKKEQIERVAKLVDHSQKQENSKNRRFDDSLNIHKIQKIKEKVEEKNDALVEKVNDVQNEKVEIKTTFNLSNTKFDSIDNHYQVKRGFSRIIKLVDDHTFEEFERYDQDIEIEGLVTRSGFEPISQSHIKFEGLDFEIPEGYCKSTKSDKIEIMSFNPYLIVQTVFVTNKNSNELDDKESLDDFDNIEDSQETPKYSNEIIESLTRHETEEDHQIKRKIKHTVELIHHKNGLIDSIENSIEFIGKKEDDKIVWSQDAAIFDSLDLRQELLKKNYIPSRDTQAIRVTPNSYDITERIVIYDVEEERIIRDVRKVKYVCDNEVLEEIEQSRRIIDHVNLNDHTVRRQKSEFAKPKQLEFEGYSFKSQRKVGKDIEMRYIHHSEQVETVISELPKSPKHESYVDFRVDQSISNSQVACNRLTELLKRVRKSSGYKLSNYSHSFKILGSTISEKAIADEIFKSIFEEYSEVSTSRVTKFSIKCLGPVYGGEGIMRNVKQFVYTVQINCV